MNYEASVISKNVKVNCFKYILFSPNNPNDYYLFRYKIVPDGWNASKSPILKIG